MFQTDFFCFPVVFNMKTKKFSFSPKFHFQNLIVFKSFKMIFSVFQPFYEISKRLEKHIFVAVLKSKTPSQKLKRLPKRSFSKTLPFTTSNKTVNSLRLIWYASSQIISVLEDLLKTNYCILHCVDLKNLKLSRE